MFCRCGKSANRETKDGIVKYACSCGITIKGGPMDTLIKSDDFGNHQMMAQSNKQLVKNSPWDRTNTNIPIGCKLCGRLYTSQIKIGETGIVIQSCKCKDE